jgi:hypothetical protein
MKRYNKYFSIFFGALFLFASQGFAQETYLLKELRIPQVTQENPGAIVPYDAHVSFPGLGKINVGANSPLSWGDIFYISDKLLKKLSTNNDIRTWTQVDIINLGWRSKQKNYFTITLSAKADVGIAFQKGLFELLIEGNSRPDNEKLSFAKDNFISATSYLELGLGYNREVNENISFGVNAKYLSGLFNAYTKKADLFFTTENNYHELLLHPNMQGYLAGVSEIDVERDNEGNIIYYYDDNGKKSMKMKKFSSFGDMFRNLKNHGFSLDLGARYKINDMFEVSASVLDIGFIKWQTNTKKYDVSDKSFSCEGYKTERNLLENSDSLGFYIGEYFKELGDSLGRFIVSDLKESESYIKWLNTRFNIGFSIYASPKDRFNLNFRGLFISNVFVPSGSVSYTRHCGKWFDVVVGNTFKPKSILNPGLGVNFTLNVFQLYAAVDYTNTLLYIDRARNLNVVFGINFVAPLKDKAFKASYPY